MVIWSCDKCPATFERQAHLEQHKGTKQCLMNQRALIVGQIAAKNNKVSHNLKRKLQSTLPAFIRYWLGIAKNGHWVWNNFDMQCVVPGLWREVAIGMPAWNIAAAGLGQWIHHLLIQQEAKLYHDSLVHQCIGMLHAASSKQFDLNWQCFYCSASCWHGALRFAKLPLHASKWA